MATEENKDAWAFDEKVDPYYKKGFEHGYWLKRGNSKDLDSVIHGSRNFAPYYNGLKDGKAEAERERARERIAEIRKQNDLNRDKGMERD